MAKVDIQPGDKVTINTKTTSEEVILIPSPDADVVILKLKTGYNQGFDKKDVKEIKLIEKAKPSAAVVKKVVKDKNLPTIAILHTGGTIASKVDYRTGGVVASFEPSELVSLFPELETIANIESELVANMWSDDLRFIHFTLIAQIIEEYTKKGVKGIIIGMGTDNLAVGAAALSFIVENSPIPIIFVGSQRSSDRGSADAAMNMICAARFIVQTDMVGVAICMHEHEDDDSCVILPAVKTYKLHSSRRDAFKVVNGTALARVLYPVGSVQMLTKSYPRKQWQIRILSTMENK